MIFFFFYLMETNVIWLEQHPSSTCLAVEETDFKIPDPSWFVPVSDLGTGLVL